MDTIHVGFTGTQDGMTDQQVYAVEAFLDQVSIQYKMEGYHGDCVGSDEMFDGLMRLCDGFVRMHILPANIAGKRAYCPSAKLLRHDGTPMGFRAEKDVVYPEQDPLLRNENIVRKIEILIATPREKQMVTRSGTWTTVRYAMERRIPVLVFLPDGQVQPMVAL